MDLSVEFTAQDIAAFLEEDFQNSSFSSENDSPTLVPRNKSNVPSSAKASESSIAEKTTKQLKPQYYSCTTHIVQNPNTSSPIILSFGNSNLSRNPQHLLGTINLEDGENDTAKAGQGTKRTGIATTLSAESRDSRRHTIAERKRREKLNKGIIALSALLPGLKKMDKVSVLGEATKYVKQLQERVKTQEEQISTTSKTGSAVESSVGIKKSYNSEKHFAGHSDEQLLEIEAKVCDNNVLLRIHGDKQKGILVKILTEIQKLHLTVINTSVVPFANSTIDITIVAQMEKEFSMTEKDIVRRLGSALGEFNLNFGSRLWTNTKIITFGVN
ncbi:transcription factor bHLH19-like [Cornus florida]|uniref:transcription factor bHLH19-like n=1 Tax=Cornus florida TaxID=4283 RepID=UPI0028983B1C|nr:transcription factor bHLH19-like [Cornus florida]XP_059624089.1 transcription factor bHLH19-like [Cornus florida]XP_059624090.1 transcription factor bHLH19-like [Cornus florida]